MIIPAVSTALTSIKTRNGVCCFFFFCLVSVCVFCDCCPKDQRCQNCCLVGNDSMFSLPFPWFKFLWTADLGRRTVTKQGFLPILAVLELWNSRAEVLNMDMVNDCSFKGRLPGLSLGQDKDIREEKKKSVVCVKKIQLLCSVYSKFKVAFLVISGGSRSRSRISLQEQPGRAVGHRVAGAAQVFS